MADVVDQAQQLEDEQRERALERQRQRIAESMRPAKANLRAPHCTDCTEAIEPARLKALPFTNRCASCAHDYERKHRHG